jgi:hypothetical protein
MLDVLLAAPPAPSDEGAAVQAMEMLQGKLSSFVQTLGTTDLLSHPPDDAKKECLDQLKVSASASYTVVM